MKQQLENIEAAAKQALADCSSIKGLDDLRVRFLGKKGELTGILKQMGGLSAEERPVIGQLANKVRSDIDAAISEKLTALKAKEQEMKIRSESIDITLPGKPQSVGKLHPLTIVANEVKEIFLGMGFSVADGPEGEYDYYNFEALNLPKDHPARDMQDSFYITEEILMRSQTSPVQARTMQSNEPNKPIRMIAPGRVYRRDEYDATHSPMFTQVEGLVIDEGISLADLKGTLELFLHQIFNENVGVRFRPSFFPFTEPSAEVDISCVMCHGEGCKVCKGTGWLEILGAGMVHPHVLEMSGYDPKKVSGFAFGMGVERIAMLSYGVDDLRLFYDNDTRFLSQF